MSWSRLPAAGSTAPKKGFADAIRTATGLGAETPSLSKSDSLVLMCIGFYQPITRAELGQFFGKEISRDVIGVLLRLRFIAAGPRSPTPGAPYTYVTTKAFLTHFGLNTLRDLPDMEALEDAGLLSRDRLLAGDFPLARDTAEEGSYDLEDGTLNLEAPVLTENE